MRALVVGVLLAMSGPASADIPFPDPPKTETKPSPVVEPQNQSQESGCGAKSSSAASVMWIAACGAALLYMARRRRVTMAT